MNCGIGSKSCRANGLCWVIAILSLASLVPSFAQTGSSEFLRGRLLRPGVHLKTWKFENAAGLERFTEISFPITYSYALGSRLSVDVVTAPFRSKLKPTVGDEIEFNNLTDTFARTSLILGNNLALLTVGVGLPSGETELTTDELALAGLAANRPLDNPVTSFGTGLSVSFGLAIAQDVGSWVVGLGVGYSLRPEYDAAMNDQALKIDPGDEFNATVGLEKQFETGKGPAKFTADFIYTNYSEDEFDGLPFFEAGDKIVSRGQLILPVGIFDPVILSVTSRWRLDNRATNTALVDNGSELDLRATWIQPLGSAFSLKYVLNGKIYGNTINEAEGAFIAGYGGGFVLRLSDQVVFDPTFIYSTGSINTGPNTQIDVEGIEVAGGLSLRF